MSADSASEVSGPVATMTGAASDAGGMAQISSRTIVTSGCAPSVCGDRCRETLAIDRERRARRNAARLGRPHDERTEPPHFLFEQTDGVIELVAAEGIAADELGEPIGLVDGRRPHRPHFVQRDRHAARGRLPGSFGTGEPATDDGDHEILNATVNAERAELAEPFVLCVVFVVFVLAGRLRC